MQDLYAAAIPFRVEATASGILSKEIPNNKIIQCPDREENALIIAEFKIMYLYPHQSLTPEAPALTVPLIEKALQNVDKAHLYGRRHMNSTNKRSPAGIGKTFCHPQWHNLLYFPERPSQPMYIDYIYGYSKNGYRFDVQYRKVIKTPFHPTIVRFKSLYKLKGNKLNCYYPKKTLFFVCI